MGILNNKWNETLQIPPIRGKSAFLNISEMQKEPTTNQSFEKKSSKEMILKVNQNRMILAPIIHDMQV